VFWLPRPDYNRNEADDERAKNRGSARDMTEGAGRPLEIRRYVPAPARVEPITHARGARFDPQADLFRMWWILFLTCAAHGSSVIGHVANPSRRSYPCLVRLKIHSSHRD
jgi:hypothetical protein